MCQKAFEQGKSRLASALVLVHYNVEQKIKLAVDVLAYGLGAVISHVYEIGSKRPIVYASHTSSHLEKNYTQINKEALPLISHHESSLAICMTENLYS